MPKVRIAIMLPRFSRYGGVEQFGFRLAETLAAKDYLVDFICARQEVDAPAGVTVRKTGRPFGPRWLKMLIFAFGGEKLRKKGGYDCTISLGKTINQDIMRVGGGPLQAFWNLSRLAWEPGFPRFWKQLTRRLQPANWLTLLMEQRMYTRTPRIVAISDAVREWVEEVYPHLAKESAASTPPKQVMHTIYNCPDTSRFSPPTAEEKLEARKKLGFDGPAYVVGVATTNFALKGVRQLIEALRFLPEDTHICIAGGRNPQKYQALSKKLGVASRVHFCGKIADMQSFYHGLDLFILPTFYDTLGNVVLEALACGLKTVCSNRAGAMAFLPEKRILREPESSQAIANIITETRADTQDASAPIPPHSGIEEFVALVEDQLGLKG